MAVDLAGIGQIVQGVGNITKTIGDNINIGWKSFNEQLKQEGNPTRKDWFAKFRTDFTTQLLTLAIVMVSIFGLLIVVMAFTKNTKT